MLSSQISDAKRFGSSPGKRSVALIATLAMLVIISMLIIVFVTMMRLDRSATASYSQSLKAEQLGMGGLRLIVGQLQSEMAKDASPDLTYRSNPLYTNVNSANIEPQEVGTNSAMPTLVKISTNAPFFAGTLTSGTLTASSISSTTPSINWRFVGTNIWNQAYFGTFPNNASAPYWVIMTRGGATNGVGLPFGPTTANSVNNPAMGNTNYVIGRIAYAIYDEGGLLDITVAGYPTNGSSAALSASQLQAIKGTLAGAAVSTMGIDPNALTAWRNQTTAANATSYTNYVSSFLSTNASMSVYPGDTTFLSRQDLIQAAQAGIAGLTTASLTNLTTFTRELNAPSWSPGTNAPAGGIYNYSNNAPISTSSPFSLSSPNPNRFVPMVRRTAAATVTGYLANGQSYTYPVNAGDPVALHRFPLDRLNWLTYKGPSADLPTTDALYNPGGTDTAIQVCFGLVWAVPKANNPDSNWTSVTTKCLWQYVGSTLPLGTTEQGSIKTLDQVAAESTAREPNFFELLQAGILSGSLGVNILPNNNPWGRVKNTLQNNMFPTMDQSYPILQVLRIGASMIAQVQTAAYPVSIEYQQFDAGDAADVALVASGVANLPYISVFQPICGAGPSDTAYNTSLAYSAQTQPVHPISTYYLFQLWNPTQQNTSTSITRPNVRLALQGNIGVGTPWANGQGYSPVSATGSTTNWGFAFTVKPASTPQGAWLQLANAASSTTGVNGFLNPALITPADVVASQSPSGSQVGGQWLATQTGGSVLNLDPNNKYEVFHLTDSSGNDLSVNLGQAIAFTGAPTTLGANVDAFFGYYNPTYGTAPPASLDTTQTFQILMEYQDPNGNWLPYDYWIGDNDPRYWTYFADFGSVSLLATRSTSPGPSTNTGIVPYYVTTLNLDFNCNGGSPGLGNHPGTALTCDPRSIRFGPWLFSGSDGGQRLAQAAYNSRESLWSGSANANLPATTVWGVSGYGESYSSAVAIPGTLGNTFDTTATEPFHSFYLPAWLCRNNMPNVLGTTVASSYSSYNDTDGIQRIADSGLFTNAPTTVAPTVGNPFYMAGTRTSDRPVILNRPFNSVGEIGYTFRDDPWRSLDFFSAYNGVSTSPDSGLLDLFTVSDTTNSVVAGRVNLNTRNTAVLQAIFNSTVADPTGETSDAATLGNPGAMATNLATYTSTAPLSNKSQLVTGFGPSLPTGGSTGVPFSSVDEQNVKACREAYIRALADVGQTRTWNLMIDIVAQAGRYPPTATSLDQFVVESERRYWLHVAIDRFTGKIIDERLEPVSQ